MKDEKVFIDTNVFVYAKLKDEENSQKRNIASTLLTEIGNPIVISTRVLNEFSSVMIKHYVTNELIINAVR